MFSYQELCIRFTGQEYDDRHGHLDASGRRDAQEPAPQLGIFTTADTIFDKNAGAFATNRHMYVRGNPITYSDPSGHFFWIPIVIGAALGAVMGGTKGNPFKEANWRNFDAGAAVVGGFAGAFAGGMGYAAGIALGGFSGAVGGVVVGGATGGFINGFGNHLAHNGDILGALGAGISQGIAGGLTGAVAGAAFYGIMHGVNELWHMSEFGKGFAYRDLPCLGSCAGAGLPDIMPTATDIANPMYSSFIPPWLSATIPGMAGVVGGLYAVNKQYLWVTPKSKNPRPDDFRKYNGQYYQRTTDWDMGDTDIEAWKWTPLRPKPSLIIEIPSICRWIRCRPAEENLKLKYQPVKDSTRRGFLRGNNRYFIAGGF